jgi:hypothetical protein
MKNYTNEILESTSYVVEHSKHVQLNKDNIAEFCKTIPLNNKQTDWLKDSPVPLDNLTDKEKAHLMMAFNSLSFSYWGDPSWRVTYDGKTNDRGSWSLIASIVRAKEEGIDILNPKIQANISRKELKHILRGNVEIPLLDERLAIINQVGTKISRDYNNDFRNMISQANYDATKLLSKVIESFPLFEDTAQYDGQRVCFYKRAQALVESIDSLENADKLTALADYKLPVPLRDAKILTYSPELEQMIDNKQLIQKESNYEIEIRANTIWAVENIRNNLSAIGINLHRKEINDYLWLVASKYSTEHHRTRTTAY